MPLDKAALGTRYTCFSCGAKFYDLNREEPTCPACGSDQRDNPNPDPREALMSRLGKRRRKKKAPEPEATATEATSGDSFMEPMTVADDDDEGAAKAKS